MNLRNITRIALAGCLAFAFALNAFALNDVLKLKINGNGYSDETIIRYLPGATTGFDSNYDAWKIISSNSQVPTIYTEIDSASILSINALPDLTKSSSVAVYNIIPATGTYTITGIILGAFPANVSIALKDNVTGTYYNLTNGDTCTFNMTTSNGQPINRFSVYVTLPPAITAQPAKCHGSSNGSVFIDNDGIYNWSYKLTDESGNVLNANTVQSEKITIGGLYAGNYILEVKNNPFSIITDTMTVSDPAPIIAQFSISTSSANVNDPVYFDNTSQNANSYTWDFGDSASSGDINPTHSYTQSGTYTVLLKAADSVCTATATAAVTVSGNNVTTSVINVNEQTNPVKIYANHNGIVVSPQFTKPTNVSITVMDLLGRVISMQKNTNVMNGNQYINLAQSGYYLVRVQKDNGLVYTQKVAFVQ